MIIGLGSDMVDVRRIARSIERYGERFLGRIYTPAERAKAENRANKIETYAKRFAAKEACSKALGTGFANGMWLRDAGVVHDPRGKPEIIFSPRGEQVCQSFGVSGGHITLSDEAGLIVAFAILMQAPSS